ncbi:hypothetical protein AGDE_17060 [Angomonas deanei]|uniref:Uncharacterized protein n=1 Tax=Angomonas deanei TaxID=59799 RepID=A0A7G2C6J0_9TRYP|nr:hypothetical protein AGDE_17060 [Angomonas deanei]CAD2214373.1 hypothetical protein, conserved [Angomonas deanei]|eukprot:EPY15583.1 hypothetical protein AGDE_17060 [Angomonas deanei]
MPKKIQLAQDNAVAKVLDESYVVFQHADTSKETAVQLLFVSQEEAKGFDFYVTPVSRWEFIEPPVGPPVPLTFTERAVDNPHGDHSLRIPFLLSQRPIAQLVQVIRGEQPAQPDLKSYLETLMAELAGIVRQAVEASAIRSDIVSATPFSEGAGYGVDRNCEPSAADTILVRPSYTSIGVPQEG